MSEPDNDNQPDALPRVSVMLVEARTALGLSQKEVADQLFLTTNYIRFMDEGEFQRITKTAYIKGYLRTYARVVGLSGDEVVALYQETIQAHVEPVEIRDVTEEPVGANRFTGPVMQTGVIALAALLVVVLLVWLFSGGEKKKAAVMPPVVTETPRTASEVERPLLLPGRAEVPVPSADDAPESDEMQVGSIVKKPEAGSRDIVAQSVPGADAEKTIATAADPATARIDSSASNTAAQQAAAPTKAKVAAAKVVAVAEQPAEPVVTVAKVSQGAGSLITVTTPGSDKLEFTFTDECWIEVADSTGSAIYGDLSRSGDTLVVYGTAPFEVLFGKAPAVQMEFNGERINLARYTTTDQTAKIKVPR
jgi:cytoskeleton protein RodZ